MKKILIFGCILLSVFIIYLFTRDNKVYYLSLGDNNYAEIVSKYLDNNKKLEVTVQKNFQSDYRITDLINDINNNVKIGVNGKEKTIKNALIKADLLTLSIGMNDIISKINSYPLNDNELYVYVDKLLADLDNALQLIRQYCKEDIFLIGMYYPDIKINDNLTKVFSYYNDKAKELAQSYKIKYIDIYNIFLENSYYLDQKKDRYPSNEGYQAIADQIIISINNTILKNG